MPSERLPHVPRNSIQAITIAVILFCMLAILKATKIRAAETRLWTGSATTA